MHALISHSDICRQFQLSGPQMGCQVQLVFPVELLYLDEISTAQWQKQATQLERNAPEVPVVQMFVEETCLIH